MILKTLSWIIFILTFSIQTPVTRIVFYGDSITAGYGVDLNEAYPAEIERILKKKGYSVEVINAGSSGETSAGGVTRINWILKKPADIFILELGGNDGLRGLPLSETKKNLQTILDQVKTKNPNTKLIVAGMEVPPNLGQEYTAEFRNIFPSLAKNNQALLIPFILENVGGYPELNQTDGIHPNAAGHKKVAEKVAGIIEKML